MSIGLIVSLIVLIAVVLTLVVRDNDDNDAAPAVAPAGPPAFTSERMGDGVLGGYDEGIAPPLQAHTGEFQGEGRMNPAGPLAVDRPMAYDEPMAGEGRLGGYVADDLVPAVEPNRLTRDEMLFNEWNDPLGWTASPAPATVMSAEDMAFLEMNGVYDTRTLTAAPAAPKVESFDHIRFIEINTIMPGWTDSEAHHSDRQQFTEY